VSYYIGKDAFVSGWMERAQLQNQYEGGRK